MKILAGFVEDGRHSGIDKYLLNFLDRAREAGHGVDFLTSVYDAAFAKELEEKGSRLYAVPNLRQGAAQEKRSPAVSMSMHAWVPPPEWPVRAMRA